MIAHVKSLEDYDRVYRSELSMLLYAAKIRSSFFMREAAERAVAPVLLQGPSEPVPPIRIECENRASAVQTAPVIGT